MNYLNRFLRKSGVDKDKTAVDVINSVVKSNGSATVTPRSVSPTCSTPTHSNVGDTTTDEFESAEEGTPRKLSLTALAEQLEKVHLSTPKEPADPKKPFVFPYTPVQEELLAEEDGRDTPLLFGDSVEKFEESPVKSAAIVGSAICNVGSYDACVKADLTKCAIDLQDPTGINSELKVSPNSSANELDETLLFHANASPAACSPLRDIPDFQEPESSILNLSSVTETAHADEAITCINHIAPDSAKHLPIEPTTDEDVFHVTVAETPSLFNPQLCTDGVEPTQDLPVPTDYRVVHINENPTEGITEVIEKICLEAAEQLKNSHPGAPDAGPAVTAITSSTENVPGSPIETANESPNPISGSQPQDPAEYSIAPENPVICVTEDGQLKPFISTEKDRGSLNSSATETLSQSPNPDAGQAELYEPVELDQSIPSPLNATVISAASNESGSPVSAKTEISELADNEDENVLAPESEAIPTTAASGVSPCHQEKTSEALKQDQQGESPLAVKMTLDLCEPVSASTPESELKKKEDSLQTGLVEESCSQVSLGLAVSQVAPEQAISPVAVTLSDSSFSDAISPIAVTPSDINFLETISSDDGLDTSQLPASEPEPTVDCMVTTADSSVLHAVPANSTFSLDDATTLDSTVCLGLVSAGPELNTTQTLSNEVEEAVVNAGCESDLTITTFDPAVATSEIAQSTSTDDKHLNAAPLNVTIDNMGSYNASDPVDTANLHETVSSAPSDPVDILNLDETVSSTPDPVDTVNLDETVSSTPIVNENLQSEQVANPAALNGNGVMSSCGSSHPYQFAIPAPLDGSAGISCPSDAGKAGDESHVLNETVDAGISCPSDAGKAGDESLVLNETVDAGISCPSDAVKAGDESLVLNETVDAGISSCPSDAVKAGDESLVLNETVDAGISCPSDAGKAGDESRVLNKTVDAGISCPSDAGKAGDESRVLNETVDAGISCPSHAGKAGDESFVLNETVDNVSESNNCSGVIDETMNMTADKLGAFDTTNVSNVTSTQEKLAPALSVVNGHAESEQASGALDPRSPLDQTIDLSESSSTVNPTDSAFDLGKASSPATSNVIVDDSALPEAVGSVNNACHCDETVAPVEANNSHLPSCDQTAANTTCALDVTLTASHMSSSTSSLLAETVVVMPNLDVTTQPNLNEHSALLDGSVTSSDAPADGSKLDSSQFPISAESASTVSGVKFTDDNSTSQNHLYEGNDDNCDMNSSQVLNERLNKLMAEGDEVCAVPVPSAEVLPTSEKLAKAVKFEDCPPEVLEKYQISPKRPAPKKRFSMPVSSDTNSLDTTISGSVNTLPDTSSGRDTTIVNGTKSRPSLMGTSYTIAREPQAHPRSSLMDFAEAGPQMSQILATCSRQEHDLQSDTFSCIQEEAAKIAEELQNDQTGANSDAAGTADKTNDFERNETFQPASDFDFDFLSKVGGNSKFAANLARKSLYVKFDPLVEKAVLSSSDDPESDVISGFVATKQSLAEDTKADITLANETQTEVTGDTREDERLIPITPLASKKPSVIRHVSQTPSLRQEISRLQEMMLQQEAAHQEKEDLVELLKQRISVLEAGQAEAPAAPSTVELEEKDAKIATLKKEIQKSMNNNKQLVHVMGEYEKTISQLVTMKEEMLASFESERAAILAERDEALHHLSNMEMAFNDVHQKYERAKTVIEAFHANELSLKQNYDLLQETLKKHQDGYFKFKQHAHETLQQANEQIQIKEREISRMKVVVKKDELKSKSLQDTIAQKDKEILELTQICDELIAKS